MKSLTIGAATVGVLAAAFGFAGPAAAAPTGDTSATDVINQLRAQGYNVQVNVLNGPRSSLLSECTVKEVTGMSGTDAAGKPLTPAEAGTVNVDVNCPEEVS
jgi:hypothetical protein